MTDHFGGFPRHLQNPGSNAFAITPEDDADLAVIPRAIYVGSEGDLTVVMADQTSNSTTVTFTGVLAGSLLPIRARRVRESSTAGSLVGIY